MTTLSRRDTIAVLGGGVSGLTFADAMRARGFGRVVVFEKEARVGGKSCTVQIDGRPHDLGATMGVPIDYEPVLHTSRRVGIATIPFPAERHYDMTSGRAHSLNRWRELPAVLSQAARYAGLHAWWGRGVDGAGLHHAPPSLHRPWAEVVRRHRLSAVSRRTLVYRTGYGYGFDDEVPAVMYANLFRPQTFLGLALHPSFMWQGGTQPIWERLARTLDVRTATAIERIERQPDGVVLHTRAANGERASERFARLVVTVNPREILPLLDASEDEHGWFSDITHYPYATFACQVDGLDVGRSSVGYLDDNMVRERPGHPMAWVKRYGDQPIFVFHLFAPPTLSDDQCAQRIAADMARLGGRFVAVRARRRWPFFPHFSSRFMERGGLTALDQWQGRTRTYLIGEVLSFASMARVAELATTMADRLAAEAATTKKAAA